MAYPASFLFYEVSINSVEHTPHVGIRNCSATAACRATLLFPLITKISMPYSSGKTSVYRCYYAFCAHYNTLSILYLNGFDLFSLENDASHQSEERSA